MKKLAIICTACLVIITAILVHRAWSEYRNRQEAEAFLSDMEANKLPRVKVTLPPDTGATPDTSPRLVVSVDDAGGLRLNSEEVGTIHDLSRLRAQLEQVLKERGGVRPDKTVYVRASSRLKYVEIKKVIDAVKAAGANPVGLQTEFEN